MNKVPILVLAFNRPDHIMESMKVIREYQPRRLYLACDGPRNYKEGEMEAVNFTRETMINYINWPCDVKTLFREENLGCAKAVSSAISWFFDNEEYGIIIEDDIIVSIDFFRLCEKLLPYYKDEEKIMQIAAHNPCARVDTSSDYSFLHVIRIWGWATWRRAWKKMDMSMSKWPEINKWDIIKTFGLFHGTIRWLYYWGPTYKNLEKSNSWATRWYFSCYCNNGLSICPNVNLIKNLGLHDGTHFETGSVNDLYTNKIGKMIFPLNIKNEIEIDKDLDRLERKDFFRIRMIGIKKKILKIFKL